MIEPIDSEEQLGTIYDWRFLRRLWPFIRTYRCLFGISLVLIVPRALLEAVPGLLWAVGLNHLTGNADAAAFEGLGRLDQHRWLSLLTEPRLGIGLIAWLALILLLVTVVHGGLDFTRIMAMAVMGQRAMRDLRRALFDHVQRLPVAFFDTYPVGRLVTRLTNDVENLSEMFTSGVVAFLADLVLMVFFVGVMLYIHVKLAAVTMLIVPFLALAALFFRYRARQAFREVRIKIARINAHLNETISGIKIIQLFAQEQRNARAFESENASYRHSWFKSIRYDALLFSSVDFATNVTIAITLWYGARLMGTREVELGLLFLYIDWMGRFFRPLMDLSAKYSIMQSSMSSCERIFQLLDTPIEKPDRPFSRATEIRGEIVFRDVSFAYAEQPVLKHLSFRVASGERVALVGHTGSGKTTALKLLDRLYEPQHGSILIDGVPIGDIPRAQLRKAISFILQDAFLFQGDLRYNLALGDESLSDQELIDAVEVANAGHLIQRCADGWCQEVRERGVNFSTGERQLLCFARALARRPRILLLDEATANIDTETETLIQDAVGKLMRGTTSIVAAHRLATIQDVDRIYVLHQGVLRESGTHQQLLAQKGLYWRLFQLQNKVDRA
ncbi:MAG: ABC transporter ATP-binding protein [Deltaproteobacteria bacterium]|nr:ABC transporter ATP-binding protein [Deltaproteobacteria bacterium]